MARLDPLHSGRGRLLIALAALLFANPARAAWTIGGNVLASGPSNQAGPYLVSDGSGGVFVYWTDDGAPAGQQIMAQHVNAVGSALWTAGGINVPIPAKTGDIMTLPVTDQQGGSILIVNSLPLGLSSAQRLDSSGAGLWGSTGVNLFSTTPQVTPPYPVEIAAGGSSPTTDPVGAIAAWDEQVSPTGSDDIYAQRLDASGTPLWGSLASPTIVCSADGAQGSEVICTDGPSGTFGTHGAWIAWSDARLIAYQIYINRISNGGTASWPDGVAVLSLASNVAGPYMDYFGSNSALVTWSDSRNGEDDIYGQKVLPSGAMAWAANGVRIVAASGGRSNISMVPSGSGGEILAWFDNRFDSGDVYAQAIDASGNALWDVAGVPVCVEPNRQIIDGLVSDGSGGAYVLWLDKRNGTTWAIYGQHLDSSGNALWDANGKLLVPLAITTGILEMDAIPDGVGSFYLCWHDKVSTSYDAFISRFDSSGNTYAVQAGVLPSAGKFQISLASPNPARGAARLSLDLAEGGTVSVDLMDVQGRLVRTLAEAQYFVAGTHELGWDGLDDQGRAAGSGVYFALARQAGHSSVARLVETR